MLPNRSSTKLIIIILYICIHSKHGTSTTYIMYITWNENNISSLKNPENTTIIYKDIVRQCQIIISRVINRV